MTKKLILWDNDGVLVNTEKLFYKACKDILKEVDIDLTKEMFIQKSLIEGGSVFDFAENKGYPKEKIDELRKKRGDLYLEYIKDTDLTVPGMKEVLQKPYGKVKMGIVTNSYHEHFLLIHKNTGLLDYVDFFLTIKDYVNHKPHPEPFLIGLKKAGVDAKDCMIVEDTVRGVRSAVAANIDCIAFVNELTKDSDFSKAIVVVHSPEELLEYLEKNI